MARFLKQSTSVDVPIGPFLDPSDGVTPETTLTLTQPDIRLKKNGGNWAQKNAAQTLSHEENGFYEVTLDTTDTNTLGLLRLAVFESGAAPVWEDFLVVPANVWDSLFGSDLLDVNVSEYGGTTAQAASGRPQVDLELWLGSAPNALSSGRVDGTVGAMQANVITAAATDPDFGTEIGTAVWASGTRSLTIIDEDSTTLDLDGTIRGALGMASADMDTQLDGIGTAIGGLNDISVGDILTTPMTESYSTKGGEKTLAQGIYEISQRQQAADVAGTTATINKLDGTTSAFTLTLDDATNPTSVERAT